MEPQPPLAAGLSDVALGAGGGVWRWLETQSHPEGEGEGAAHSGALPHSWMEQSWFKAFCLHAVCLAEPEHATQDDEGWGAVSAVPPVVTRAAAEAFVLRASRDLEAGAEVLLDYGPRPNFELLTTHGFALRDNPHEAVLLELGPREADPLAPLKARILDAGNITAPFALSPRALHGDTDLLVALRVIAATASELRSYHAAFEGRPLSTRNERHWRLLLRDTVSALLEEAEAETSAEQDELLLQELQRPRSAAVARPRSGWSASNRSFGGGGALEKRAAAATQRRRQAAVTCRLGEKLLLHAVRAELDQPPSPLPIEQRVR
eukprot:Transcript_24632.p1 GENE.Transcript_24632~~Transcript_24632.p1  ORF type:complete len:328 (+),score=125.99 Transcript_24632:24-986(+)